MKVFLIVALTLQLLCSGFAQAAVQSRACGDAAHRQFDFWLGSWRVTDRSGRFQGTNDVTVEFDGCVIQEHWKGSGGSRGSSFNTYLPGSRAWQQTWVDNKGLTLRLIGGLQRKAMVLSGNRRDSNGETIVDRITWTPLPDGRVRQHWEERTGQTGWREIFDGFYAHQ